LWVRKRKEKDFFPPHLEFLLEIKKFDLMVSRWRRVQGSTVRRHEQSMVARHHPRQLS
jgi:hypothetical protein